MYVPNAAGIRIVDMLAVIGPTFQRGNAMMDVQLSCHASLAELLLHTRPDSACGIVFDFVMDRAPCTAHRAARKYGIARVRWPNPKGMSMASKPLGTPIKVAGPAPLKYSKPREIDFGVALNA